MGIAYEYMFIGCSDMGGIPHISCISLNMGYPRIPHFNGIQGKSVVRSGSPWVPIQVVVAGVHDMGYLDIPGYPPIAPKIGCLPCFRGSRGPYFTTTCAVPRDPGTHSGSCPSPGGYK